MQVTVKREGFRKRGRPKGLSSKWAYIIEIAVKKILDEYKDMPLTIRQIFYRLVGQNKLSKTESNYNYLCKLMVVHRQNNYFPWERIVDLTRKPVNQEYVGEALTAGEWINFQTERYRKALRNYFMPLYTNQEYLIEIWSEHDGLRPIFEKALEGKDVTLFFTRGRNSWSAFYEAHKRLRDIKNRKIVILHFSDLDKYGLEMTEDINTALNGYFKLNATVNRIALTERQVQQWGLVDTQLEAIDPLRFIELIKQSIEPYINKDRFRETLTEIGIKRGQIEGWMDDNDIDSLTAGEDEEGN